jgi:protein-S-isoprenylcysteine O-methyltransferase Ste14
MLRFFHLPPVYFLITTATGLWMHRVFFDRFSFFESWISVIGFTLLGMGLLLDIASIITFRKQGTKILPFSEASSLVGTFTYRFSRNPMYLGLLMIQIGLFTALGAYLAFLLTPILWAILNWLFVLPEESMLEKKFERSYSSYKLRTRRWI